MKKSGEKPKNISAKSTFWLVVSLSYLAVIVFFIGKSFFNPKNITYTVQKAEVTALEKDIPKYPPLDTAAYDLRMIVLANNPPVKIKFASSTYATSSIATSTVKKTLWPVHTVYPGDGAILPFKRIIAYYGNFYSKGMGVLGQYPSDEVLSRLMTEVNAWTLADPNTPAIPAIHYIAVTAQGSPGADGKYRLRMPSDQIDKAISMAAQVNGLVFLDVQVGLSNVQTEIPLLAKYLAMPQVHLGIDPEFSIKDPTKKPGEIIGTMDASDINFVIDYLTKIVRDNNLPPKILVIHRFTEEMVTNYQKIETVPEVQVIMNMDGWGFPARKINTYEQFIYKEPVEFTGFKLFYKNDTQTGTPIMSPADLLKLNPRPIYIQYQ